MSEAPAPRRRRRWGRLVRRLVLAVVATAAAWLALIVHPQPLFAFTAARANVVLHARAPLPPQAGPLLDEVVRRVSRSPLYDPARVHHVFLCDSPALFAFFEPLRPKVGGVAQVHLTGNIFIRPSNIERGTVVGASGEEKKGERTLTYFIAHEVMHAMTGDAVGRLGYFRLAAFQTEGYADYVAFDHRVDLARGREALVRDDPEMSPRRSGLYRRYELLVAYLLERKGLSVAQLLAGKLDGPAVEASLLADEAL